MQCSNEQSKYLITCNQNWTATSAASAGGRPFLDIQMKDFKSGESTAGFFERHRQDLIDLRPNYSVFELGLTRGETVKQRNYIHMEYLLQPSSDDCIYHVVEHVFRSQFYPVKDYGIIISAGVCENQQQVFNRQRGDILSNFEEVQ